MCLERARLPSSGATTTQLSPKANTKPSISVAASSRTSSIHSPWVEGVALAPSHLHAVDEDPFNIAEVSAKRPSIPPQIGMIKVVPGKLMLNHERKIPSFVQFKDPCNSCRTSDGARSYNVSNLGRVLSPTPSHGWPQWGTLPPSLHSLLLIQGNIYAHCSQCVPLLRGPSWNICSLSGCRRTGSGRCCALWSTYFIKGLIELITAWISALTTGTASVLITSLTGRLAGLPTPSPNPDYSWNVALTSHIGLFHPDGISEVARISKTGARGFVHGQFGRVAGRHQPTDIILA